MKTGAIIYVTGEGDCTRFTEERTTFLNTYGVKADRLEIITRNTGHADIHDAWWRLMAQGMQQVFCMMAKVDNNGEIQLTGRQMRLCG